MPDTNGTTTNGTNGEHSKPKVSKPKAEKRILTKKDVSAEEKLRLFQAYSAAMDARDKAEAALEVAKKAVSAAVSTIVESTGSLGPWNWKGNRLVAMERDATWYMRVQKTEAEEIG